MYTCTPASRKIGNRVNPYVVTWACLYTQVPEGKTVSVRDASTVLVVRKIAGDDSEPHILRKEELGGNRAGPALQLFDADGIMTFGSGWQVLMQQNEIINWMRSTPEKLAPMRYPGEFKFAGGAIDAGETPLQCAKREFEEEMLRPCGISMPGWSLSRQSCGPLCARLLLAR